MHWLWKLINLLDFKNCGSLCLSQFVVRNSSLCERNQLRSLSGGNAGYQMKTQQPYLILRFRETPVDRSSCVFTLPHSE